MILPLTDQSKPILCHMTPIFLFQVSLKVISFLRCKIYHFVEFEAGVGGGGRKRRGLGPRNDVLTTCKAVNPRARQRSSKAAVYFLMISTLALSIG